MRLSGRREPKNEVNLLWARPPTPCERAPVAAVLLPPPGTLVKASAGPLHPLSPTASPRAGHGAPTLHRSLSSPQ